MATKAPSLVFGEDGLFLPQLINHGLAANDRLKYYLTLIKTAYAYANAPGQPAPSLRVEREASGVTDASLDHVVGASTAMGSDTLRIPAVGSILEHLFEELRLMLLPLRIAGASHTELGGRFEMYQRRLDDLVVHAPPCVDDHLAMSTIKSLTGLSGNGHDTVYQLAIDLLNELNRLQNSVSMETIDGARVYDMRDADRVLVRAFMKGINETAYLKFDHPGLDTTATREGEHVSIQSHLGTPDAHGIVVRITGMSVTVTYTDVHRPRLRFLQNLLRSYDVKWTASTVAAGADHEMTIGVFTAGAPDLLQSYLTYLGSRLVFLIDWNRARKRLARLIKKSDAIGLLKWAADNNIGHRAFLQAGDVGLVDSVLERTAPIQMRGGTRLDKWLGRDAARLFLMSVLRSTLAGVTSGYSSRRIGEEIEAELLKYLHATDPHLLQGAVEHAMILSALAEHLHRTLMHWKGGVARKEAPQISQLAKTWSARADEIALNSSRPGQASSEDDITRLLAEAGGAVDALEEAAFMLTLLPASVDSKTLSLLDHMSDVVDSSVREYVRSLEKARDLFPAAPHADIDSLLGTIDRLAESDREANALRRTLTERLLRAGGDFHELYVVGNMAGGFERAAMAVARCGVIVRDRVLSVRVSR